MSVEQSTDTKSTKADIKLAKIEALVQSFVSMSDFTSGTSTHHTQMAVHAMNTLLSIVKVINT